MDPQCDAGQEPKCGNCACPNSGTAHGSLTLSGKCSVCGTQVK